MMKMMPDPQSVPAQAEGAVGDHAGERDEQQDREGQEDVMTRLIVASTQPPK
jgi:hypothetical protein